MPVSCLDYSRPGILPNAYLEEFIPKAAAAHARPVLPMSLWASNEDNVLVPEGNLCYALIGEGTVKLISRENA